MSRLSQVLTAIKTATISALNDAGITTPAQVGIGHPNYEDLTKIITASEYQVSIFTDDSGTKDTSRFLPQWAVKTKPNVTLQATISGDTVTFSGTVPSSGSQFNIHTIVGSPLQDAYCQTVAGDSPSTVAARVASAINALGIAGVTANASAGVVTVSGSSNLICNVGGSGTMAREVLRVCRLVTITSWCPDEVLRDNTEDAIISSIGNAGNRRLALGDGTNAILWYKDNHWDDDHEQDFSMYRSLMFYTVEYSVLQTQQATQIGAFRVTPEINGASLPDVIEG